MNIEQARKIKLTDLIERLGYEIKAIERGQSEHKYLSPWRAEVEASLNVNLDKNVFYDFGEAEGGDIIDFAKLYLRKAGRGHSTSDALQWLEDTMGKPASKYNNSFSFRQASSKSSQAPRNLEFVKDSPLKSEVILKYLKNRRISPEIACKYLRLIQYRNNSDNASGRLYFGFGQRNVAGGWEVRSASDSKKGKFKSALIARDITIHKGSDEGRGAISVFEGMLDHLSLLELLGVDQLRGDALIMNALSSYTRAKEYALNNGYSRIDLFLDNNDAGRKAVIKFQEDFGHIVFDHSAAYKPHIDLNDSLRASFTPKF